MTTINWSGLNHIQNNLNHLNENIYIVFFISLKHINIFLMNDLTYLVKILQTTNARLYYII